MTTSACDAIVGYHLDPHTCGVAKFNAQLADQLGVEHIGVFDVRVRRHEQCLVSLKIAEMTPDHREELARRLDGNQFPESYDVFLHEYRSLPVENQLIAGARRVLVGNAELAAQVMPVRSDPIELFCPGTIATSPPPPTALTVFTFGMAHKLRADHFERLDELLSASGEDYALYLSVAVHEGTDFQRSFTATFEAIQGIFRGGVHFLGSLSDEAVASYLESSTFFAAFFERGCRANNTSVNAALASGAVVITNLDEFSPGYLRHGDTVLDIEQLEVLPDSADRARIAERAAAAAEAVSWDAFLGALRRL